MVLGLRKGPQATLWIGTLAYGLASFDPRSERFSSLSDSPSTQAHSVSTIWDDGDGNIWSGTTKGLYAWDLAADPPAKATAVGLPESFLWDVRHVVQAKGAAGQAWVTSHEGLFQLDRTTHELTPLLEGINATTVLETGPEAVWLGTVGGGLLKVNPAEGSYVSFTTEDGLPGNIVRSLTVDQQGSMWIATTQGIAWMDLATETIRTFSPAVAPPIYEFYPNAALVEPDGKLLFGGNGGILRIDPAQLLVDPHPPHPVISSLQLFDQRFEALPDPDFLTYQLNGQATAFSHDQNDLTFEYAGLHYLRPEENTYRYRLTPYEDAWREVGSQRTAIYPNLPPGSYRFEVQAANPNGIWSEQTANLRIEIRSPWWQRPAAFVVYGLLFLFLLFVANRLQRRRLIRSERTRARVREAQLRAESAEAQAQQLQALDEAKTRLYANITHEFRTPLTVILGMTDRIRGHAQERSLIRRNSQNLLRLINQMLDLSKVESGNLQLRLVQGDIIPYLQYLTESFYSLAQEKEIRLLFYPEVEALEMAYDEEKIQHIVYNLLSNALKFTPAQGKVVMHAIPVQRAGAQGLQLKVQDTGVGLAESDLKQIFDRFYQVDASQTRKGEGTGIGLALTRELVELMQGEISVSSSLGKGTTFSIFLPIQTSTDAPLAPSSQQVAPPPSVKEPLAPELASMGSSDDKPLLVLIEDNADVTTYITALLQPQYRIYAERNGQAGLDRVLEVIPDIVISDVMMPEKDGFEVCQALKTDERTSHIPIILLTARSGKEDRLTGLKGGADAYLVKPFEKEELFIRLEKLRELRLALKERYEGDKQLLQTIARKKAPNPEEAFLQKLIVLIQSRIDDPKLGVNALCRATKLSNTQVNRKLKALVGKTPSQFIRSVRLQRAVELLETTALNISEIGYAVGFGDPNYFSRVFSEEFGYAPSEMRK